VEAFARQSLVSTDESKLSLRTNAGVKAFADAVLKEIACPLKA
jgi:hypothetical protein